MLNNYLCRGFRRLMECFIEKNASYVMSYSLTCDPDVVQICRFLTLPRGERVHGELQLLPVQRVFHPQLLIINTVHLSKFTKCVTKNIKVLRC